VINWNAVTAIATVVSMVAFVLTALYVRGELKALEKDRYLAITSQMFAIWESREFMDAQLWLLHRLQEQTWEAFVRAHRGDAGEAAFHRVGSFYNRLGTLVRLGLINQREMLTTIGAFAIAVWQKIQPLVHEARRREHSTLFQDFERLLPACYECYVPTAGPTSEVRPFTLPDPDHRPDVSAPRITLAEFKRRLEKDQPLTVLDVRQPAQVAADPRTLPQAVLMPAGEVEGRHAELPADREVIVYCA
jgi:hypothetical protein